VTAIELIARLRERGIRIAARDGELEIDAPRGALDAELRGLLVKFKPDLLRLLSWSRRSVREIPLEPAGRDAALPLSWSQQRLWFLDQLEPASAAYNISWTVRLHGELHTPALEAALSSLVRRHETLRTRFPSEDGEPRQVIEPAVEVSIVAEDQSGAPDEQLRARLNQLAAGTFDLANGPLMRMALLKLGEQEHILLVVIHHIVADGASMRILFRELAALYEANITGGEAALPELAVQYADYAVWQRRWLDSEELQRQTDYWLQQLQGAPPLLELPADRPRAAAMRYRGASVLRVLPASLADELRSLGRAQGSTLFMVMLAAFFILLRRYAGRDDLLVGAPMGGRPRTDLEGLIGFFINTVVLRADLSGDPAFTALLRQVREVALGAHANQELPFEKLVEVLQPDRELSYSPVFQVMFDLQEEPRWRLPVKNLEVVPEVVFSSRTSSFDLTLSVRQAENGLDAMFEYDTDLFDESTIERMASHYQTLLEGIVAAPEQPLTQLPLIDQAEQQAIVHAWGSQAADYPDTATLQSLFAAQAGRRPDAVALEAGEVSCSYGQLHSSAGALAARLQTAGVVAGQPVALLTGRDPVGVVGMLAILQAGGVVVPLDPDFPVERLAFMLNDSGAGLLLATDGERPGWVEPGVEVWPLTADVFAAQKSATAPVVGTPDSPAFLLYTSGTTGQPKGTQLLHRGLINYLHQLGRRTGLGNTDRVLQFASPGFDIALEESFAALLNGATLVLREPGMNLSAEAFVAGCESLGITWTSLPTAWWHELCAALANRGQHVPAGLRCVIIGGEKARRDAFETWRAHAGHVQLLNTYGPTETSIAATWCELDQTDVDAVGQLPIGHPVPNVYAWVLDEQQRPLPAGVPGELYIGGIGVSRGYWQRPGLTAERFLADPFGAEAGGLLYRTGDRARYLPDGQLVFLGRIDQQIKLRGHRIEPAEIETQLVALPEVESAVVVVRDAATDGVADQRLVAYYVAADGAEDGPGLRRQLGRSLPDYMVPAACVRLERLPLTVNGKLDIRALPEPEWSRSVEQPFVAPRNEIEQTLARIWADILGLPEIGVHDDFFALGGHSLLATRVVSRIREAFVADLPLREIFETPTVAGLAHALESSAHQSIEQPLARAAGRTLLPLSWAQQRLWMLDQLEASSGAYHLPWLVELRGEVDEPALQAAVDALLARHESLRTVIVSRGGEPLQLIAPELSVAVLSVDAPDAVDAMVLQELLTGLISLPFDLSRGPLLRVHRVRLASDRSVLLVNLHHIIADGWSVGVLARELSDFYSGFRVAREPELPPLPVQYGDYALWQREQLDTPGYLKHEQFWVQQLSDAPALLELPADFQRPQQQSYRGDWVSTTVPDPVQRALKNLAAERRATLFMVTLTVFKALLAIKVGRQDVLVGTPVAGREWPALEGLIGCFLNTLVLRTQLAGDPEFRELLDDVRQTTLDAFEHQSVSFERLLELLQPERSTAYTPVVQVMFNLHNTPPVASEFDGLDALPFSLPSGRAKFDLAVSLVERAEGLEVGFEYSTDLFSRATMERWLKQYVRMLERIALQPDMRLSELVLDAPAAMPVPQQAHVPLSAALLEQSIPGRFADIVREHPEKTAVVAGPVSRTYAELDQHANAVAAAVLAHTKGRPERVGLWLGHDAHMLAGVLGVLKAGCAYVPLERSSPPARNAAVLAEAGVALLVTDDAAGGPPVPDGAQNLPHIVVADLQPLAESPVVAVDPDALAYILFTSGSTGRPKGVVQSHRNVLHHMRTYVNALHINADDRLSLLPTYGFDAAAMDIYAALLTGACLCPVDLRAATGPAELISRLDDRQITLLHTTPTVWRFLFGGAGEGRHLAAVRAVVLGGEEATPKDFELFNRCFAGDTLFVNGLGPSESTTALQFFARPGDELPDHVVPVGSPVQDTEVVLLNADDEVQAIAGELCIRSPYVAKGYLHEPGLTADRFVPAADGETSVLYRTGDMARYLDNGMLVFMGRLDQQLKLSGQRVELGEIEYAVSACAGGARCAVVAHASAATGQVQLVAYVVADGQSLPSGVAEWRLQLRDRLPDAFLPHEFVAVGALPLLANGKLDRGALPAPFPHDGSASEPEQPQNKTETQLAGLWREVLGLEAGEPLGRQDDFFQRGGHSLAATRLLARVRKQFAVDLTLADLFRSPTIARLAEAMGQQEVRQGSAPELVPRAGDELPPLSWAQQRLWFLDQLEPDNAAFNLHWATRLRGALDERALQVALDRLVARHDSLRTAFTVVGDEPVQVIRPAGQVQLQVESLAAATEERIQSRALDLIRQPFELQSGVLLRVHLLQIEEHNAVLLLVMHHIVSDGWSTGVLFRDLTALYNEATGAAAAMLPELPVQYADYALWQRAWLTGKELRRQETYWRQQLLDAPPLFELPLDRTRPPVQRYRGAWVTRHLSAELTASLHELAHVQGATLFMVLLAAFKILLVRYTGREDIVIGAPIAGRRRTELENLIGYFLNTLVLRTDLGSDPNFTEVLRRVRETTLGAYDHQELPFEKLLEIVQPVRSTAYTPVVQVTFNLHNEPGSDMELDGVTSMPFTVDRGTSKYDLSVAVMEGGERIRVGFEYNTDLFEVATMEQLIGHMEEILQQVLVQPELPLSRLPLSAPQEQPRPAQLAEPFPVADKAGSLVDRFTLIAGRYAERAAVATADRAFSYGELEGWANAVAGRLADNVPAGAKVGVLLGHDAEMVAGLLGVLKAGCAYVPLDPHAPAARLAAICNAADIGTILCGTPFSDSAPASIDSLKTVFMRPPEFADSPPPGRRVDGDAVAYTLFTSGSTGTPKGVVQSHRNVLHHIGTYTDALQIGSTDCLTLFSGYGFDAAVMDIYGALLNGACLLPLDIRDEAQPGAVLDRMGPDAAAGVAGVTVLHSTPTVFRYLMRQKVCRHDLSRVRAVVLGGEEALASDFALFRRHFAPPALFVNGLGPSESTLALQYFADHQSHLPGQLVPVGRPVAGMEVRLLNSDGNDAGVSGELALCSRYVSTGYWNAPEFTAKRFVPAPTPDEPDRMMYLTGDRARRLPDGQLVFVGRVDAQVKVRGHRIEPGEIEAHIAVLPGVDRCAVVAWRDTTDSRGGDARLVAYVTPDEGDAADAASIRAGLKSQLPAYMVPQAVVMVEKLPLLANGKVDRHALPEPEWGRDESQQYVAPRTETETQLAGLWAEILGISRVSVHDDFFELGGHSLQAAQLVSRIIESHQVAMPLRRLFDAPTIAGLAEHVDTLRWALGHESD